ncbi:MAG: transglutaminase domain-containing protein [Deltaproteobacteria bacterium]|nr:transglutaminase domain-containing protein [Deltaproteobacteria bacterium]
MKRVYWILLCFVFAISAKADSDLLHEYIPDVSPNEADRAISADSEPYPTIAYNKRLIAMPGDSPVASDRPSRANTTTAASYSPLAKVAQTSRFTPDRITEFKGSLSYYDSFNPSIAPFKRVTALGRVSLAKDGKTPILELSSGIQRDLSLEDLDADPPDARPRDRFWGDVLLDFSGGPVARLPSVSPESRIFLLHSVPRTHLKIKKDEDDNYYAKAVDNQHPKSVRLRFLTDAPRSYFSTPVPLLSTTLLEKEVVELPRSIKTEALNFAKDLGLTRADDLRKVVHTLTGHFRSFEESATGLSNTGDIYLDLVRGLRGVCRHRAYGFVITAQALGVPARFLMNEAHSWVEVKLPGLGWMRIDLGGAARRVEAHGLADKVAYWPVWPDELPRPASFVEAYREANQGRNSAMTMRAETLLGRWVPEPSASDHARSDSPLKKPAHEARSAIERAKTAMPKKSVSIQVDQKRVAVLRGRPVKISGRLLAGDATGLGGLEVEVALAVSKPAGKLLLGVIESNPDGGFAGLFPVPTELPVGDYQLIVTILIRGKDAREQEPIEQNEADAADDTTAPKKRSGESRNETESRGSTGQNCQEDPLVDTVDETTVDESERRSVELAPHAFFKITAVDKASGLPVSGARLETINHISFITDINGVIAFYEPGLMETTVYFFVSHRDYEVPPDYFGCSGKQHKIFARAERRAQLRFQDSDRFGR